MNITELCNSRRETLVSRWVERFFSGYPLDGTGFLRTKNDPFTNPVGQMTREAAAILFDAAAGNDMEPETVKNALESLVRLRSVQPMPPSQAVGALYLLKTLLREEILPLLVGKGKEPAKTTAETPGLIGEYLAVESRVDSLALLAFDMFVASREKVFQLRVDEVKRGQSQVVRWAKLQKGEADVAGPQG